MKAKTAVLIVIVLAGTACTSSQRYLERGQKLFDAGKYEDAALSFRKAIQKDANLGEAYYKLALTHLKLRKFAEAYYEFIHAVDLLPDRQDVKVTLATFCVQSYDADPRRPKALYDEVVKLTGQMEAKNPNGYDTLRFQGYLALIDGKFSYAITYLEKANQAKPWQGEVVVMLVQALVQDQRLGEAEKVGRQMIENDKGYGPVYDALYGADMAANRPEQAESILKSKVANNPNQVQYALQLASHYARLQKSGESAAVIKNLLDHSAGIPQVYLETGNFYAALANWEEARRLYEEGAEREPKERVAYEKGLASVLLAQDKEEEAARMLDTILREAPKDEEALRLQAVVLLNSQKRENIDKATTEFEALSKEAPNDLTIRLNLARAYIAKGNMAGARGELTEVVRRNPTLWPGQLLLAEVAFQTRQYKEMLPYLTLVLAVQPANPRARLLRAFALKEQGQSEEARKELNRLIQDQPKYTDAELQLGFFDLADKKYSEAEAIFRKLYQPGQGSPQALEGLVTALTARGQPDEAFQMVQAEMKKSPSSEGLWVLLAKTAARAGKADVAIQQLQQTAKENPKSYVAHILLGNLLVQKGDLNQAIAMYTTAQELSPTDPNTNIVLASLQKRAGRTSEAIASYRRVLELQPDNGMVLNDLAFELAENGGNLDEALQLAQRAVQKLNYDPNSSDTLGWVYLKKSQLAAALQIFNTLVSNNPENPVFRYHLGAALAAKGDRAGARAALGAALSRKPGKQDEAKIKELLARLG